MYFLYLRLSKIRTNLPTNPSSKSCFIVLSISIYLITNVYEHIRSVNMVFSLLNFWFNSWIHLSLLAGHLTQFTGVNIRDTIHVYLKNRYVCKASHVRAPFKHCKYFPSCRFTLRDFQIVQLIFFSFSRLTPYNENIS